MTRTRAFVAGRGLVVLACTAVTCAPVPQAPERAAARVAGDAVELQVTAVPLNPDDGSQDAVGRFTYAGGISLAAAGLRRFGGLSDLEVLEGNRLLAVSDEGEFLEADLILDSAGRLAGLAAARLTTLAGTAGRPLLDKTAMDAEGLAVLQNGDRLVSFERQHRIWRYPASGATPVPAPAPAAAGLAPNSGFEALTAFPANGPEAYLVGSEGGDVWRCDLRAGCRTTPLGRRVPDGFGLTALAVSPDGAILGLLSRVFEAAGGVRAVLRLVPREAVEDAAAPLVDELQLVAPLTRDNFEGVSFVPRPDGGGLRIYLLSDDNFSATQHTYLLAFDWHE